MEAEDEDYVPPTFLQKRYLMAILLFLVYFQDFTSRDMMRITAELLLEQTMANDTGPKNPSCTHLQSREARRNVYKDIRGTDYGWHKDIRYELILYFCIGYVPTQPVVGYLADRFMCAKNFVDFCSITSALLCLITPVLLHGTGGNPMVVRAIRLFHGIVAGIFPPCFASIAGHWMPPRRRTFLITFGFSGIFTGMVISQVVVPDFIRDYQNYALPYYVFGGVGVFVFVCWSTMASSSPETCMTISTEEKNYIDEQLGDTVDHNRKRVPLGRIVRCPSFLFLMFVTFGHLFVFNFVTYFLPIYYKHVLKLDVRHNAMWTAIPIAIMALSACGGAAFSDWALHNNYVNKIVLRKTFTNVSTMGATIYLIVGSLAGCERALVLTLFMIGTGLQGLTFSGIRIIVFDMSPNYAGTLTGICNGLGMITAILGGLMVRNLATEKNIRDYRNLFWIMLFISFITNLAFVIFAKTETTKWNTPPKEFKKAKRSERTSFEFDS